MIQVRHYCTHAIEDLRKTKKVFEGMRSHDDVEGLDLVCQYLDKAIKFQLPDDGKYIEHRGDYTREELEMLQLPFELIALEYYCDYTKRGPQQLEQGQGISSRRILICRRLPIGFEVFSVFYADDKHQWSMSPVFARLPPLAEMRKVPNTDTYKIIYEGVTLMPHLLRLVARSASVSDDQMRARAGHEILEDINVVIQFLQAINCSNVDHETLRPSSALNKKRERQGKLPFYEYKVLKLRQGSASRYDVDGRPLGDRAGPRQHLRRGHIRHYDPAKNPRFRKKQALWIEAMIVGDPDRGKIDKEYAVG